jgi:protein-S-isoprenylcysteine O-methyltransferase Ste14
MGKDMSLFTPVNPAALAAVGLAWLGLMIGMAASRKPRSADETGPAKRDNKSVFGIALQGVGVWLTWVGPVGRFLKVDWPPTDATWIGAAAPAAVAFLSLALFIWSAQTMGRNWSLVAQTRSNHSLVQTGPFALVRNPIYVALFGLMCANALALGHAVNLTLSIPIYIVGTLMRVGIEEKLLRAAFGAAYDDYARRVKRFIPAIW